MTKLEIVNALAECDHGFIPAKVAKEWSGAFGFEARTRVLHADPPGTFKGLTLWDEKGNPIDSMDGVDASILAEQICNHLGIKFMGMHGRGSQLRECVHQLRESLK